MHSTIITYIFHIQYVTICHSYHCQAPANPNGNMELNIIGDVVMRGFNIAFDKGGNRIGFAPVNVSTCQNVSRVSDYSVGN